MTCFRMRDGSPVSKHCANTVEYSRFYRLMDKGMTVEEAFERKTEEIYKKRLDCSAKKRLMVIIKGFEKKHYAMAMNYLGRYKGSTLDDAIKWAARTGRITLKKPYRKEYLKLC